MTAIRAHQSVAEWARRIRWSIAKSIHNPLVWLFAVLGVIFYIMFRPGRIRRRCGIIIFNEICFPD
ncbi:MAG TPA: hypothetical protein PKY88_08960 [Anaerohalosphaeraceae bacterium]|nr:hypothetical protein [Anaerohalosphaeraceae bacterium]